MTVGQEQEMFAYVKAAIGVLRDSPVVILNREDYLNPTAEIGTYTVHLEVRDHRGPAECMWVAVVGQNVVRPGWPFAPRELFWVPLAEYRTSWEAASDAVSRYAGEQMLDCCRTTLLELEEPGPG